MMVELIIRTSGVSRLFFCSGYYYKSLTDKYNKYNKLYIETQKYIFCNLKVYYTHTVKKVCKIEYFLYAFVFIVFICDL